MSATRRIGLAVSALLVLGSTAALAQSRPDTRQMSCGAAIALVESRRAIVLSTGPGLYDRYVSHGGQCSLGEAPRPAYAPTRDQSVCLIGFICAPDEGFWD